MVKILVLSVGTNACYHFVKTIKEKFNNDFYVVGNKVRVTYNGFVNESYPAQIDAIKVELVV